MSTGEMEIPNGRIEYLRDYCGSSIYIKRDDLIPFSFGGNKVRIAEELLQEIRTGGYTALISYGSPTSNMNRAAADLAKREGLKCYVIIKLEEERGQGHPADDRGQEQESDKSSASFRRIPENERLVRESGAEIIYCKAASGNDIKACVESVLELSRSRGEKPYYIYGDSSGKGNEAVLMRASYKEYAEIRAFEWTLKKQFERTSGPESAESGGLAGEAFDAIVLTVGTGMTISGLAAAMQEAGTTRRTKLVGISAARTAEKELPVITKNLEIFWRQSQSAFGTDFCKNGISENKTEPPLILDSYLCGGYGLYTKEIEETIREMKDKYGIPLDPTYTGKCFYGLLKEIESGRIKGRILFIHTGGYPGYLDWTVSSRK